MEKRNLEFYTDDFEVILSLNKPFIEESELKKGLFGNSDFYCSKNCFNKTIQTLTKLKWLGKMIYNGKSYYFPIK